MTNQTSDTNTSGLTLRLRGIGKALLWIGFLAYVGLFAFITSALMPHLTSQEGLAFIPLSVLLQIACGVIFYMASEMQSKATEVATEKEDSELKYSWALVLYLLGSLLLVADQWILMRSVPNLEAFLPPLYAILLLTVVFPLFVVGLLLNLIFMLRSMPPGRRSLRW